MLLAVRAVQWDSRSSRGRLGTFTERWADFVSGTGPAPAARPTSKRNFAPAMLASTESLNAAGGTTASASDGTTSGRGHPWGYGNGGGNETIAVYDARPGSAPSVIMQRYRCAVSNALATQEQGHALVPSAQRCPMCATLLCTRAGQIRSTPRPFTASQRTALLPAPLSHPMLCGRLGTRWQPTPLPGRWRWSWRL